MASRRDDLEQADVGDKDDGSIRSPQMEKHQYDDGDRNRVTWRTRMLHFTWAWFSSTMSTGGVALLLYSTPHQFDGLVTIGTIVFIFNIVLFLVLCVCMTTRFILDPSKFYKSLVSPTEGFFVGCFWLSLVVIISGFQCYAVPHTGYWMVVTIRVLFWIYAAVSLLSSTLQYHLFFTVTHNQLDIHTESPTWVLPIYSTMLTGTLASFACRSQPPAQQMAIIVAGVTFQGLGFLISFGILILRFGRLIGKAGLPAADQRPGLFMGVGSPGFTIVVLIGVAEYIPTSYGYFAENPMAAPALKAVALFAGIFLWLLAFFFFLEAMYACINSAHKMGFVLSWWAFIFPNVGFTLATSDIGTQLKSEGILWVTSAMTILVVIFWLFDLVMTAKALYTGRIMWPGKDEDKDD